MATNTPEASQTLDLLEKNSTDMLIKTERDSINTLNTQAIKDSLSVIEKTTFYLNEKYPAVSLDTIVKNYERKPNNTGVVTLKGENIPVKKGSDLAAWIQIFLIAKGKHIASNGSTALGIDAVIGENTTQAISDYRDHRISKDETTPNQSNTSKEDLDIDSLIINQTLINDIMGSITTNNLIKAKETKADIKKQQIFNRGKNNGILDENGLVRSLSINIKTKTCIITVVNQKTGASTAETYNIPLENILINRSGEVSKERWVNEMYKVVSKAYEKKTAEQKKLDTEKEKKDLQNLTKEWNDLQNKATKEINAATSAATKSSKTEQYSNEYTILINKIIRTKVTYTKAEYKKLADHIKYQKSQLDKTNIETNYPNFIKEKYATLQKNIESSNINIKWLVDSYIQDVKNISIIQNKYANRGMKRQILELDLNKLQNRLEKQTIYLASKTDLDRTYTILVKKFDKEHSYVGRKKIAAERKPKVVLMENGTYKNNNQPTTYKQNFASVDKIKEYDEYVKKFKELVI